MTQDWSEELDDIEFVALEDSESLWEPTVRLMLRPSIDYTRDLAVDVEDAGYDLLDRATESPPHMFLLGALPGFAG